MPAISILTDSAAQFPNALYEGSELVSSVTMQIQLGDEWLRDSQDLRIGRQLAKVNNDSLPRLHPPTVEDFVHAMRELSTNSDAIICILSSDRLFHNLANASQAAELAKGSASIQIIDSQTTGLGLGLLIQSVARAAISERNPARFSRLVRGLLAHVYSAFVLYNLHPLALHGQLDIAQAAAVEMLGLLPFYVMEGGRLVPMRKARSSRQVIDLLLEFAGEFSQLNHIAVVEGPIHHEQDLRSLRERLAQAFPDTMVSEHTLGASLVTLFGAHTLGLAALEEWSEFD